MFSRGGFKLNSVNDLFVLTKSPFIELSPIEFAFVFHFPQGAVSKVKEKVLL